LARTGKARYDVLRDSALHSLSRDRASNDDENSSMSSKRRGGFPACSWPNFLPDDALSSGGLRHMRCRRTHRDGQCRPSFSCSLSPKRGVMTMARSSKVNNKKTTHSRIASCLATQYSFICERETSRQESEDEGQLSPNCETQLAQVWASSSSDFRASMKMTSVSNVSCQQTNQS